jgi:ABC-2 type transport system ATP-binding protein
VFYVASLIEVAVMIGVPIALGRALARRYDVRWSTYGAGVVAFLASQLAHLPFNAWVLGPALPGTATPGALAVTALALGLSAGLFEESARWLVLRFWRRSDRSGPHALMLGAGHGGIESMLIGAIVLLIVFNVAFLSRVGVEGLGLGATDAEALRAQLDTLHGASWWLPLVGALERLLVIPFHVAASCLVMVAIERRAPIFWVAAVLWHVVLDAGVVAVAASIGPIESEAYAGLLLPLHALIIYASLRALPRADAPPVEARPDTPADAPLALHGVHKRFGTVVALDGVSFTLRAGERACLLGPNGAGKTTAIRIATGALEPTRGFAFVLGTGSREPEFLAKKRRVGIVPQHPGLYAELTVRQYLELVRSLYEAPPFDAVAERLGLGEVMDRSCAALSGGMQRRVSLAAALLPEPELLILDEPSAGLDPVAARGMIDWLGKAAAGRTSLLCTHNLAEAEELCETVVILDRGKVLVHESIEALRRTAPTRLVLRAAQGPEALRDAVVRLGHADAAIDEGHVSFVVAAGERDAPALLRALLADGLDVFECRVDRPTLEDLFLHHVGKEGA